MTKPKTKIFDIANYLNSEEMQSAYLSAVLEDGSAEEILQAIRDIAKAKGIAKIAQETGLGRESLYKTLSEGSQPRFSTILKIIRALNIHLSVKTIPVTN